MRAYVFNQNITNWDVSAVESLDFTFHDALQFNQDISGWNVASVQSMVFTFYAARSFNQDLSSWDVSAVTDFDQMFRFADVFDQDLCVWGPKIQSSANMNEMFANTNSCPTQDPPDLSATPNAGPFCHVCI